MNHKTRHACQRLLKLLNIEFPLIQAPMAGGATTPEFVAAVSNRGCLGSIGAGYLSSDQLNRHIQDTHHLTAQPVAVNLFVPQAMIVQADKALAMQRRLNAFRQPLGLPTQSTYPTIEDPRLVFEQQMDVILSHDIPIFSFTFGIPDKKYLAALQKKGVIIIGTATNLQEGRLLEAAGCHAIVAQGYEAGGHRGTFCGQPKKALLGLMAFIPQLTQAVSIPVIAAGGLMSGHGVSASLALGAAGAQMGTALLSCHESGIADTYKQALLDASGEQTQLTDAFSGKLARGLENDFMLAMDNHVDNPSYPLQHYLTTDIRTASAHQKNPAYLSLWAGQGVGGAHQACMSIAEKIDQIKQETKLNICLSPFDRESEDIG